MPDILDEASALVQCKECPWYKSCVTPMRLTPEDVRRQLQAAMPGMSPLGNAGMSQLVASMAAAAQSMILEGCPVFIERLRASPKLAERLKRIMQGWSLGEQEP